MINLLEELLWAQITVLLLFADGPLYFFAKAPTYFWFYVLIFSNVSFINHTKAIQKWFAHITINLLQSVDITLLPEYIIIS